MKTKLNRFICAVLSVVLLIAAVPAAALAEEEIPSEWTYRNSILVTVASAETREFTPEDFPEIDCRRVIAVSKYFRESQFEYNLVLILFDYGNAAVEKALEFIKANKLVKWAGENDRYELCKPRLILNHSVISLRRGETATLKIEDIIVPAVMNEVYGISFTINRNIIDDSNLTKDSFKQYGIDHFWPIEHEGYSSSRDNEGCRSEKGYYCIHVDNEDNWVDIVDRLSREPGFLRVDLVTDSPTGGSAGGEDWKMSKPGIAEINLSGGYWPEYDIPWIWPPRTKVNQTATVIGITPGTVDIVVSRDYYKELKGNCIVKVLDEWFGDVNEDNILSAGDALLALQNSVGIITLSPKEQERADVNKNGKVDTADALKILQLSIGIYE